jgi:hypothetical protein
MKSKRRIPWRNKTPYGWWIASYVQRFEWKDDRPPTNRTRCLLWENTIILKAKDREAHSRRGVDRSDAESNGRRHFPKNDGGRDKVMDLESVKTRLGISWGALLIGSALPELLLGLPHPSASFN